MAETVRPGTTSFEKSEKDDIEIEIGQNSIMTIRISCGPRTTVTPEVIPQHWEELLYEESEDPDSIPDQGGANV